MDYNLNGNDIIEAEKKAAIMDWGSILNIIAVHSDYFWIESDNFKSARFKLESGKTMDLTSSEASYVYKALKSAEQQATKIGRNKDAALLRAIYRESVKFQTVLDKKGSCYVATAAYGSYNHPQVMKLRLFRDMKLSNNIIGRCIIKLYYFMSPIFTSTFGKINLINRINKKILDKFILILENKEII